MDWEVNVGSSFISEVCIQKEFHSPSYTSSPQSTCTLISLRYTHTHEKMCMAPPPVAAAWRRGKKISPSKYLGAAQKKKKWGYHRCRRAACEKSESNFGPFGRPGLMQPGNEQLSPRHPTNREPDYSRAKDILIWHTTRPSDRDFYYSCISH